MSMLNSRPDPRPDSEASSQPGDVAAILTSDSTSLGLDASTRTSPPLVEPPGPGDKMEASEGKRKQEDDSDTVLGAPIPSKKLKLEVTDAEEFPLMRPEAMCDAGAADVDNPANVCDALRLKRLC